jgi:hypothetical protein
LAPSGQERRFQSEGEEHMRHPWRRLIIGLAATFAGSLAAQKPSSTTNVTTTVFDYDTAASQLLLRSDDYNSTLCGGYCAVYSGALNSNVQSYIGPAGAWNLGLHNQSVRTLYVTPDRPYGTDPIGPPANYYWQNVQAYSLCYDQYNNPLPLPNVLTYSGNCSLAVDFNPGGTHYKLIMSPVLPAASCPAAGCPMTGTATVTCNAVSGAQCVNWTITPNTSNNSPAVSNLYYYSGKGSQITLVFVGQYYNTYRIGVTNP